MIVRLVSPLSNGLFQRGTNSRVSREVPERLWILTKPSLLASDGPLVVVLCGGGDQWNPMSAIIAVARSKNVWQHSGQLRKQHAPGTPSLLKILLLA